MLGTDVELNGGDARGFRAQLHFWWISWKSSIHIIGKSEYREQERGALAKRSMWHNVVIFFLIAQSFSYISWFVVLDRNIFFSHNGGCENWRCGLLKVMERIWPDDPSGWEQRKRKYNTSGPSLICLLAHLYWTFHVAEGLARFSVENFSETGSNIKNTHGFQWYIRIWLHLWNSPAHGKRSLE